MLQTPGIKKADPRDKLGTAAPIHNAGRVEFKCTTNPPRCLPLNIVQFVHIDLCTCCGEPATVTAFLADYGRVKLCGACAYVLRVDHNGGNDGNP